MDKKAALKAVGARIRKLRQAKGISQEEAARLAGIGRPTAAVRPGQRDLF
jgi:DNA-binding XRE family transcriptional regulator